MSVDEPDFNDFDPAEFDQPIELPIEDHIDLHTFAPKEIKPLVEEYLYQCHQRRFPLVRIIHGKGIGVQREIVRSILSRSPYVTSFSDADPHSGGWGATLVVMKYQD